MEKNRYRTLWLRPLYFLHSHGIRMSEMVNDMIKKSSIRFSFVSRCKYRTYY